MVLLTGGCNGDISAGNSHMCWYARVFGQFIGVGRSNKINNIGEPLIGIYQLETVICIGMSEFRGIINVDRLNKINKYATTGLIEEGKFKFTHTHTHIYIYIYIYIYICVCVCVCAIFTIFYKAL